MSDNLLVGLGGATTTNVQGTADGTLNSTCVQDPQACCGGDFSATGKIIKSITYELRTIHVPTSLLNKFRFNSSQASCCCASPQPGRLATHINVRMNDLVLPPGASLGPLTVNFTGDTSSGSPTISNVSSFTDLLVGQTITGTGIPADTVITVLTPGSSQLTMSQNATATNTGVTLTASGCITDTDTADCATGDCGAAPRKLNAYLKGLGYNRCASADQLYTILSYCDPPHFSGDTTNGSPTITNISCFGCLHIGQLINGTGIPANTLRVIAIDTGANTITLSGNATATNTGVSLSGTGHWEGNFPVGSCYLNIQLWYQRPFTTQDMGINIFWSGSPSTGVYRFDSATLLNACRPICQTYFLDGFNGFGGISLRDNYACCPITYVPGKEDDTAFELTICEDSYIGNCPGPSGIGSPVGNTCLRGFCGAVPFRWRLRTGPNFVTNGYCTGCTNLNNLDIVLNPFWSAPLPSTTFTGDITSGSNVISNVSNFDGLLAPPQVFTNAALATVDGTGIPFLSTISSYDASAQTITLSKNATATATGATFTRKWRPDNSGLAGETACHVWASDPIPGLLKCTTPTCTNNLTAKLVWTLAQSHSIYNPGPGVGGGNWVLGVVAITDTNDATLQNILLRGPFSSGCIQNDTPPATFNPSSVTFNCLGTNVFGPCGVYPNNDWLSCVIFTNDTNVCAGNDGIVTVSPY